MYNGTAFWLFFFFFLENLCSFIVMTINIMCNDLSNVLLVLRQQLGTGCRAHTSTIFTVSMALVKERSVSFSLLVLGPPCCLVQLLVLLLTNSESFSFTSNIDIIKFIEGNLFLITDASMFLNSEVEGGLALLIVLHTF